jgi:hypothetical protein
MTKKIWIPLLVLVLLVIVAVGAKFLYKKQPAAQSGQPKAVSQQAPTGAAAVAISSVPSTEMPQGLPNNIPWESGAAVLQNFTAKDPATGKTQSTRVYVSKKTLDANFTIYQKYLQDNGWTVNTTVNKTDVKNLSATKSGARLDITIAKNTQGQVSVNVSYLD